MTRQPKRSKLALAPPRRRTHLPALLSRILPAGVLAVGLICWLMTISPGNARAQQPYNGQPGGTPNYGNGFGNQGQPPQYNNGGYQRSQYPNGFNPAASGPQARTAMAPGAVNSPAGASGIPAFPPDAAAGTAVGEIMGEGAETTGESTTSWLVVPGWVEKIISGGWLMLPLAFCSLVVLTLSFERLIALRRSRVIPRPFVHRFTECVEDGVLSYEEATELCKEFDCPVSEVFRAALRRWGRPMFEIEQAVMDAGDRVSDGLRKYLRVFHAISNVAPLIGLLGTVIGMIGAFEVISDQESIGRPETLASGISMALMTTAGGLSVAIPAYLAYMYFSSKSDRYLGEIEKLCQRVIDCISAEGLESANARTKKRKAA